MKEIILLKVESIEKCIKRIEEKLNLLNYNIEDYDIQDVIVLNLQRACQQSIDLAMFICAEMKYGVPKDSLDAFSKLLEKNIITQDIFKNMKGMIGFRNIAIHQYQRIDYSIVEYVIKNKLFDFYEYNNLIMKKFL